MYKRIRKVLLLIAVGLVFASGYLIATKFKKIELPGNIRLGEDGASVVIENFKILHEESGRIDWELRADVAQMNKEKSVTHLKKVNMLVDLEKDQKFYVTADTGIYHNATREFELEGNIHLKADSAAVAEKIRGNHKK
jgi:LPS export ABC transporter protein LptC